MKRRIVFSLIIAAAACGCGKNGGLDIPSGPDDVSRVRVGVVLQETTRTKVTGEGVNLDHEDDVNSVQVFVYDSAGNYDCGGYDGNVQGGDFSMTLEVSVGEGRTFCALVNADELDSGFGTLSDLEGTVSYLSENSTVSFVMYGSTGDCDVDSDGIVVEVPVGRLAAKVIVQGISVDFAGGVKRSLHINSIYLTNVNPAVTHDGTDIAPASQWAHQRGWSSEGSLEDFLTDDVDETIADGGSYSVQHNFYCYPNPTEVDSRTITGTYCERYTRLVIDTDYGYYPIDVPGIESNKCYLITSLTIAGEGSRHPEVKPDRKTLTFALNVLDWEDGASYSEHI